MSDLGFKGFSGLCYRVRVSGVVGFRVEALGWAQMCKVRAQGGAKRSGIQRSGEYRTATPEPRLCVQMRG